MNNQQPIGIFDSGIGGLTVAGAIRKVLPQENLVYFGDTAHMPYGEKSADLIVHYALQITDFLLNNQNCKAIVIACNTASAVAYEPLREKYKGTVPVINVIDPMIEELISHDDLRNVGIIATKATIKSGVYQEKISRRKPSLKYSALATPLLASMIEEGFFNDTISHAVLNEYLNDPKLAGIDSLVLACTHYPLIKKEINAFYNGRVKIFDSAEVVAKKLKAILEIESIAAGVKSDRDYFYVSDYTRSFEQATRIFFNEEIKLDKPSVKFEQ